MKINILKITLLMLLCFPFNIFASSIEINCPSSVTVGNKFTCTVTAYHDKFAGLRAKVSYSGMEYNNVNNLTQSDMFIASSTVLDGVFDISNTSKSLAKYTFNATKVGTAKLNIVCEEIIDGTSFSSVSCNNVTKEIVIKDVNTPSIKPNLTKSNDASLKSITISVGNIEFSQDKYNYDIEVDNKIKTIEITSVPNNNKAKVKIDGDTNLKVGNNILKINVIAEDGKTKKTYTINVIRRELSNNNKIKNIVIKNYNIEFDSSKKYYDLSISDEDSLIISVELENKYATYEIKGNEKLKNKSNIKIEVTAEDGSTNIYTINIKKKKDITKKIIIILILSVIVNIITIGMLIRMKKIQ